MLCAEVRSDGVVVVAQSQPVTVDSCVAVIASPSDIRPSPFNLSIAQGGEISAAILSVWAVAAVFKALARLTYVRDSENEG